MRDYDVAEINTYGNMWILSKTKNQNKSNKHPKVYFSDVSDTILKEALIDRNLLDYRKYRKFYKYREKDILEKIKKNMRLNSYETKFIN